MSTGNSVPVFSNNRAFPPLPLLLIRSVISAISNLGSTNVLIRTNSPAFSRAWINSCWFLYAMRKSKTRPAFFSINFFRAVDDASVVAVYRQPGRKRYRHPDTGHIIKVLVPGIAPESTGAWIRRPTLQLAAAIGHFHCLGAAIGKQRSLADIGVAEIVEMVCKEFPKAYLISQRY